MEKPNRVVIIGANGFVARNLRNFLSSQNIDLISISRTNFKQLKNEIKIISKDYKEEEILPKIKNCNTLIHLVGIGKQSTHIDFNKINVDFTKHIINLSKKAKIKKLVYLSGLGVNPKTSIGYFISKYKAERLIVESKINYTIFRPSYIIGKYDYLTKSLKKQIKKRKIVIPGSGNYSIQPIHIDDVVKIILKSISQKKFNNLTLDLVGPELFTFKQYVEFFSNNTETTIQKTDLEKVYNNAINNSRSGFDIDDLNILVGDFRGNYSKLQNMSKFQFQSIKELLNSGVLL